MSEYQQITADEAREGDLVRVEYESGTTVQGRVACYVDNEKSVPLGVDDLDLSGGLVKAIYLIDRPSQPKIPADAEYVMWSDAQRFATRTSAGEWISQFVWYTPEELTALIGDEEVTVLVPKAVQS